MLIDAAMPRLARSGVMNPEGTGYGDTRTSWGMNFARDEFPLLTSINQRIGAETQRDPATFEQMQVARYRVGEKFDEHWDYFHSGQASSESAMARGGNRTATFMCYLRTPDAGGDTMFPDANGLRISPIAGDAVYFEYPTPTPDTLTKHAGMPVIDGEKWIFNVWMREGNY